MAIRSFRIPINFVLEWTPCFSPGFVKIKKDKRVLDLGTGTGIIPILLEGKTSGKHFTGLEIQEESVDMARRSVAYNHLEERISIIQGDIKSASSIFGRGIVSCGNLQPAVYDI